jgi:hypothetical protein
MTEAFVDIAVAVARDIIKNHHSVERIVMASIERYNRALAEAGYVIVPREPTEAMYAAGKQAIGLGHDPERNYCDHVWRAMVDAALSEGHWERVK